MLVVLAEPQEALRWIAAAEYALPLKLARQVSFVVGCDNVSTAGALVCGIARADFLRATPGYLADACLVFDPEMGAVRDGMPAASGNPRRGKAGAGRRR